MAPRIDYTKVAPRALREVRTGEVPSRKQHRAVAARIDQTARVQINGYADCIDIHSKDARAAGESEQRLYGLAAWREAPYYTERERAALAWTEALTR